MADKHTRTWITFFQNAGIQDVTLAARYAAIFVENEIRSSMLAELDMELLRVMGISKVGHVLGILKHAKHVHDTQLFAASQPSPPSRSHSSGTSSPVVVVEPTRQKAVAKKNRSTGTIAASRIIEHYVKQPDNVVQPSRSPAVPAARTGTSNKKPRTKVTDRLGSTAASHHTRPAPTSRPTPTFEEYETDSPPPPPVVKQRAATKTKITDRLGAKPVATAPKRKMAISFEPEPVPEEVPVVKRVRRVLPEHEGGYRIRMPAGTTPRSREILAKMSTRHPMTVFDRLGDASVSSTTEVEEPTITITGFGSQIVKTGNSVFSRLGGRREATPAPPPQQPAVHGVKARLGHQVTYKSAPDSSMKLEGRFQSEAPTPSSYAAKVAPPAPDHSEVQYVGVLKKTTIKKTGSLQSRLGNKAKTVDATTSTKRNSSAGILGNPTNSTKLSAKERLDLSARDTSEVARPTKTRKFIMTNKKTGVKTIVYKMTDDDEPPKF